MTSILTPPTELATPAPRWGTRRNPRRPTRGGLDREIAGLLGWRFFSWQQSAADVAGEYDPFTRLLWYRTVGISVARQSGKTVLVCVRIARQLIIPRQTVAYTAQDRTVARLKWSEHVEVLMSTPFAARVARVDLAEHREQLVMRNGSRYLPVTPTTKKAGRALSIDLAVIDEAQSHDSMGVLDGLRPTMIARPNAQLYLLGTAGDDDAVLWSHYTNIGRAEIDNPDSTVCWIEYAGPDGADPFDLDAQATANPSLDLPGGVSSVALGDAALTMDADSFRKEHFNLWINLAQLIAIDAIGWAACRDDDLAPGATIAIGLAFSADGDAGAVVVAGDVGGRTPLEVIDTGSDVEALIIRAGELANRWQAPILIGRGTPAASAGPALERATAYGRRRPDASRAHRVRLIAQTDVARACGDFHTAAVNARLAHRGDPRLTDAVAGATKRRVGQTFVWAPRGAVDISALDAATLARWGVITAPEPAVAATATVHSAAARRLPSGR